MKNIIISTFVVVLIPLVFGQWDIISLCNRTPYPDICTSYITIEPQQNLDETLLNFRKSAFKSTITLAQQAHKLLVHHNVVNRLNESVKHTLGSCIDLYTDTLLNHLNSSLSCYSDISDVQARLIAAVTNAESCEHNVIYLKPFSLMLISNFTKLLSNSLAINVNVLPLGMDHEMSSGRKLLRVKRRKRGRGLKRRADVVVAQDGSGNYGTISEALEASKGLERNGHQRFIVYVKRGVYAENVVITDTMINYTIVGDGIDKTIVTGSRSTKDGYKTFDTATFAVEGNGFIARYITFENTAGPTKEGAVALRSDSDLSIFYKCSFRGYQDTLYVHKQRQFYRNCDIYGTVDFIFGDAATILQNCNIYVRRNLDQKTNTITAQGRVDPNAKTGIVIHDSVVTAAPEFKPVQHTIKTYLGRPWQPYARTVFMKTYLDGLIDPDGWLSWEGKPENVNTLYYAEYMNSGPGSDTKERVNWPGYHSDISRDEAERFSVENFLGEISWIEARNVPFSSDI